MDMNTFICCVPVSRKNAISLEELSKRTKLSKRTVRAMIEAVNRSGTGIIVNLSDGKGYFIPDETEEQLRHRYRAQEVRRFVSQRDKLEGMNRYLGLHSRPAAENELERNQLSLFDLPGSGL